MNRRIVKTARAIRDLEHLADFLWKQRPAAALRFVDEAEKAFQRLVGMPGMGTLYGPDQFGDLRDFPLSRFKSSIVFYRPIADGIERLARPARGEGSSRYPDPGTRRGRPRRGRALIADPHLRRPGDPSRASTL